MEAGGLLAEVVPGLVAVLQCPVETFAEVAVFPIRPLRRQQFFDALEYAAGGGNLGEIQVIEQTLLVEFFAYARVGGHHVGLAGEDQSADAGGEGKFFGADAVEREKYTVFVAIQHGQREGAVDMFRRFAAMSFPERQQGVGGGYAVEFAGLETGASGNHRR